MKKSAPTKLNRVSVALLSGMLSLACPLTAQVEWFPIDVPTDHKLLSIDFPTVDIGYIGGQGVLMKTLDGGLTWNQVEVSGDNINLDSEGAHVTDLHFFDADHGLLVIGEWGGLFRTLDGGATWTQEIPASDGFCRFKCVLFEDEDHGLLGGGGCFQSGLVDSYDTGIWNTTDTPETFDSSELINAMASKENIIIAVTNLSRILRSADSGETWVEVPQPVEEPNITDVALMQGDIFRATYAAEESFGIMKSEDLGLTWEIDGDLATFFYPDMFAIHESQAGRAYVGGIEGNQDILGLIISQTEDFWSFDLVAQPIFDITSYGDSVVWAVGDSGAVFVNVNPLLLSLEESSERFPHAIYPNPCENELTFEHWLMSSGGQVLITDVLGKSIVPKVKFGQGMLRIDTSDLPSGRYILTYSAAGAQASLDFVKE